jgi:allophanate hydrolase subunit 2
MNQPWSAISSDQWIECLPGPHLSEKLQAKLNETGLTVHPYSDRRGVRLSGDVPTHELRLPSEPQCVGSIQWTPSGELIILGPDGPTIGGYPQIGFVIEADISRVGQLKPGSTAHLRWVTPEQAEEERLDEIHLLRMHRKFATINFSY